MGVVDWSQAQMFMDDGMYESFIHVKFTCLRRLSQTCNLMFTLMQDNSTNYTTAVFLISDTSMLKFYMLYLVKAKSANGTNQDYIQAAQGQ